MSEKDQLAVLLITLGVLTVELTTFLIGGLTAVVVLAALADIVLRRIEEVRSRRTIPAQTGPHRGK